MEGIGEENISDTEAVPRHVELHFLCFEKHVTWISTRESGGVRANFCHVVAKYTLASPGVGGLRIGNARDLRKNEGENR